MKITIDLSDDDEGTDIPYWLIIDPKQNMRLSLHAAADQITGPFFSRHEADAHLEQRHYAFSKRARVYCHSGHWTTEYKKAIREKRASKDMNLLEKIVTFFD